MAKGTEFAHTEHSENTVPTIQTGGAELFAHNHPPPTKNFIQGTRTDNLLTAINNSKMNQTNLEPLALFIYQLKTVSSDVPLRGAPWCPPAPGRPCPDRH